MNEIMMFSLCGVLGYFLGSIPFGLVITYLSGHGDVRKIGSKSIGGTNVLRATNSKFLTILTILLDAFKAGFAAFLATTFSSSIFAPLIAGLFAILGHSFPVWLNFKGGKGVASAFGLLLFLSPQVALLALLTWIAVALITKYSSLSAIIAAILVPVYAYFLQDKIYMLFYIPMVILILIRHKDNFKRLFKGEETKINFKKKAK